MTDIFTLIAVAVIAGLVGYRIADHLHKSVMADLLDRAGVTPEKMEQIMKDLQSEINGEEGSATEQEFPILKSQSSNILTHSMPFVKTMISSWRRVQLEMS